jgi:hypothetical protein
MVKANKHQEALTELSEVEVRKVLSIGIGEEALW